MQSNRLMKLNLILRVACLQRGDPTSDSLNTEPFIEAAHTSVHPVGAMSEHSAAKYNSYNWPRRRCKDFNH